MKYLFIQELFADIDVQLEVLKRKTQRSTYLLYQHEGTLLATSREIKNKHNVENRLLSFLEIANEKEVDLAITPEYSCPWKVVNRLLEKQDCLPGAGKLWVLGCESATLPDLEALKEKYNKDKIEIYYDEKLLSNGKSFVDPILYIFQTRIGGNSKYLFLIQTKTHHMGVWGGGIIERDNLIQGKEIYIIKNSKGFSINLFSLICSEATQFSESLTEEVRLQIDWDDKPFLILNPQLNPKPTDSNFVHFRNNVLNYDSKEIVVLNWNCTSKIGKNPLLPYNNGRSGFYIKSDEVDLSSKRINSNHGKGLYYFNNKIGRHSFIMNSCPHLFLISNTPVKIYNPVASMIRRDGPQIHKVFELKNEQFINTEIISDGLKEYMTSMGCQNEYLTDPSKCVVDKERLASLTSGNLDDFTSQWSEIGNLGPFLMDNTNEINGRLTVAQNKTQESVRARTIYAETFIELENILGEKIEIPSNLNDLKETQKLSIGYSSNAEEENFKFNLVDDSDSKIVATVSYLGATPLELAEEKYTSIKKLFNRRFKDHERVAVFYKIGGKLHSLYHKKGGSFTEIDEYEDDSFLKN